MTSVNDKLEVIRDMKKIIDKIRKRKFGNDEYHEYCVDMIATSVEGTLDGYCDRYLNVKLEDLKRDRDNLNDILNDIRGTIRLK